MQLTHQALTLGQSGDSKQQQQPRERHLSESLAGSTSGSDGSLKENHRPTENNNTNDGRFKNSTDTNGKHTRNTALHYKPLHKALKGFSIL